MMRQLLLLGLFAIGLCAMLSCSPVLAQPRQAAATPTPTPTPQTSQRRLNGNPGGSVPTVVKPTTPTPTPTPRFTVPVRPVFPGGRPPAAPPEQPTATPTPTPNAGSPTPTGTPSTSTATPTATPSAAPPTGATSTPTPTPTPSGGAGTPSAGNQGQPTPAPSAFTASADCTPANNQLQALIDAHLLFQADPRDGTAWVANGFVSARIKGVDPEPIATWFILPNGLASVYGTAAVEYSDWLGYRDPHVRALTGDDPGIRSRLCVVAAGQ